MRKYKWNGKVYCNDDLSEEIDNYAGDEWDLSWDLRHAGKTEIHETYSLYDSKREYDDEWELINDNLDVLGIEVEE